MKYMMMCLGALVVCFGTGWIPARWLGKRKGQIALLTVVFGLILMCAVAFGYLNVYYPADRAMVEQAMSQPDVQVEQIDGGYFFDGPGERAAVIFYPGAKVETLAYAPLMAQLAEQGIDCFLADMPFRMAMLDAKRGEKFLESHDYDIWIAAGHSMGGLVVSSLADRQEFDALVMLGAYPNGAIRSDLTFCSIYGTNDGCMNRDAYEKEKAYWPADSAELPIPGGNHAQYAAYGPQSGDGEAELTAQEQQKITADRIVEIARTLGA